MRLLLIHTAGRESFVALTVDGRVLAERVLPGRASSELLLPAIRALFDGGEDMDPTPVRLRALDGVGVVHGPGSFTGVRVGLSAAKGLCEAGGLPLVAVSRLALLASAAGSAERGGAALALLDAGRGEVFTGLYRGGVRVREELLPAAAVRERLREEVVALACEQAVVERVGPSVQLVAEPRADGLRQLVERRFASREVDDVASVDANYVRRTDAELLPPRRVVAG